MLPLHRYLYRYGWQRYVVLQIYLYMHTPHHTIRNALISIEIIDSDRHFFFDTIAPPFRIGKIWCQRTNRSSYSLSTNHAK